MGRWDARAAGSKRAFPHAKTGRWSCCRTWAETHQGVAGLRSLPKPSPTNASDGRLFPKGVAGQRDITFGWPRPKYHFDEAGLIKQEYVRADRSKPPDRLKIARSTDGRPNRCGGVDRRLADG